MALQAARNNIGLMLNKQDRMGYTYR